MNEAENVARNRIVGGAVILGVTGAMLWGRRWQRRTLERISPNPLHDLKRWSTAKREGYRNAWENLEIVFHLIEAIAEAATPLPPRP
jgi:hypothetical protein